MMKYIGIDTGTKTGFAVWDGERFLEVATLSLWEALDRVRRLREQGEEITVVCEDARKRKYLPREKNVSEYRGRLMGAGSVKRDAVIWQEFCEDNGITCIMQAPSRGMTKWSAEVFADVTGWKGRTSNHARDAALLVYGR